MQFLELVGQKEMKRQLANIADESRVGHAIMFCGESGYGTLAMAIAFAQYISCPGKSQGDSCGVCPVCNKFSKLIHPDLHFAMPVNTTVSVTAEKKPVSDLFLAQWRTLLTTNCYATENDWYQHIGIENKSGIIGVNEAALIARKLSMRAFEGGSKFLILWLPERMNQEAANKLLKLIEEPPADTYLFLVSESPEKVISTILSRCQILKLPPIDQASLTAELMAGFDIDQEDAIYYSRISGGNLNLARVMIEESTQQNEFFQPLKVLLEGCEAKDLKKVTSFREEVSLYGREKQREFCRYCLEFLRRTLMHRVSAPEISNTPASAAEFTAYWAQRFKSSFYSKAYSILNDAISDIDRNVNPRYIFADIANRFFLSL